MSLPDPSHLQLAVLSCLGSGEMSGRELRAALKMEGIRRSGPGFYQLMARLEDAKWVEGWHNEFELYGQPVRERRYKITATGRKARAAALQFYEKMASPGFGLPQPEGGHA